MTDVNGGTASVNDVLAQHSDVQGVRVLNRATPSKEPRDLKYMWVFPAFVGFVVSCITSIYLSMKDTAGPLKPLFVKFEGLLDDITNFPVFQKANSSPLPTQIIEEIDQELDYAIQILLGYFAYAFQTALTLPLVPQLYGFARSVALKINEVIIVVKESGLPLTSLFPLLPVNFFDKIARSE
jgi:hypothetical protein